ncbi:SNF2-related protein [Halothece sp. PCC 7418]|uniref:DEAD/DEAH box helicase n=1 Tax=Halothece sp. (strain PCC 7418) TaxID=65093 RepID=UPI0002A06D4F|nr:DEAD/DEAH box helicase [Halothece sp. PCC 7418]AFZ43127.1 SNF2-related protein [Halothece sp. PCC 7418]
MTKLQGIWLSEEQVFFIWGETWRSCAGIKKDHLPTDHPFILEETELKSALTQHQIPTHDLTDYTSLLLSLPTQEIKKQQLLPLLSQQTLATTEKVSLQTWRVSGYRLPIRSLLSVLATTTETGSLQFWSHLYRWSCQLLARSKFLPDLQVQTGGKARTVWQPLFDAPTDQERLQTFAEQMPKSCYAHDLEASPQALIVSLISAVIDCEIRRYSAQTFPPVTTPLLKQWFTALSSSESTFSVDELSLRRLEKALQLWIAPVQDYLGDRALKSQNPFRLCFRLLPPEDKENWYLEYGLQARDDETYFLPATAIWETATPELIYEGRTVKQPQETLLQGLGLALRLYPTIHESLKQATPKGSLVDPIAAYEFIRASAWRLSENGFGVILPPGLAPGSGERRLGVKIQAQAPKKGQKLGLQSLLNYKWELAVDDQTLSPEEFQQLLAQQSPLVEVNGKWLALQPSDVKAAQTLLKASDEQMNLSVEDAVRLTSGETQTMGKLPIVDFEASGALQELITNLSGNQSLTPIETPAGFRGKLRPYQARGAGWLAFLQRWGLGACLADDMGLGKTIQTIALLLHLKEKEELSAPLLLVCPTSVLGNWEREVQRFSTNCSTLIHYGEKRKQGKPFAKQAQKYDLVITSYALAQRDATTLKNVAWEGIILDEAQNIKNPKAKQSKAVRELEANFRIALTGTPLENRLAELWSILDFLNPGYLGSQQFFQRRFATPIEKYGDRDSLQTLRSLVQPFILRRVKTDKEIIQDLPEKQEMNVYCGLSAEQAKLYQEVVDQALADIEKAEGIQRHGKILTLLMKLKQLCNHPALFNKEKVLDSAQRSGKLLRLVEMLEELTAENDRALIFTQFAEWGKLLQAYLQKQFNCDIPFLYGATRKQQRQEMVDRFQNDPDAPPFFILSIKAGGTGLNLTRANHVFHIDRWWNPAVENQATDRAFRIGQKQNVQVHKFISTGTLEERINQMIESKKQLAEQTVDAGEDWLTQLDTEQLRDLVLLDRKAVIDE